MQDFSYPPYASYGLIILMGLGKPNDLIESKVLGAYTRLA